MTMPEKMKDARESVEYYTTMLQEREMSEALTTVYKRILAKERRRLKRYQAKACR